MSEPHWETYNPETDLDLIHQAQVLMSNPPYTNEPKVYFAGETEEEQIDNAKKFLEECKKKGIKIE